jgi:Tfp pilus assembly protein PilF
MSMKLLFIFLIAASTISLAADQTRFDVRQTRLQDMQQRALAAFQAGDTTMAEAAITSAIAERRARGEDNDVSASEELAALSFSLADTDDQLNARALATRAATILDRLTRGRDSDSILRASLVAAHLQERILHDSASARMAYQRALELEPANAAAREGVARIDLEQAVVAEKIKEQQLLQERAK